MSNQVIAQTEIDGYEVIIEPDSESDRRTHCYVTRGRYSASLQVLLDMGCLYNIDREHHVPSRIIGDIENWAYSNGMM